jgi:membrane-associated protease RseP (regulator of RpoE activity)
LEAVIFFIIVFVLVLVVVMVTPIQGWLIAALALAFVAIVVGFRALRLRG